MRGNDITPARRNRRHKSLPRIAPTGTCFLSHSRSNSSIKLWWHGAFNLGQVGLLGIQTKRLLMQKKKTAYILSTPVCMPTYKLSKQQITSTKRSNGRNIKFWYSSACWSEGIHSMIVSMKCIVSMGSPSLHKVANMIRILQPCGAILWRKKCPHGVHFILFRSLTIQPTPYIAI